MTASVILLHGITDSSRDMAVLEERLKREGYRVLNLDYPSTTHGLADIADLIHPQIKEFMAGSEGPVHLLTHSMGGLVARHYLHQHPNERIQRVVMLGPPNRGSEASDILCRLRHYDQRYGPAGQQLRSHQEHPPLPPTVEAGVIAATVSFNPLSPFVFRGRKNDSRVAVESTRLDTPHQHATVEVSHRSLRWSAEAQDLAVRFLKEGRFNARG